MVPGLTDLRYLMPVSRLMQRYMPDVRQTFDIQRSSLKYNGLRHDDNYAACLRIVEHWAPWASLDVIPEYDCVIQVEVGDSLRARKRIAIQHGFDCAFLADRLRNVDAYVCGSRMMLGFARDLGIANTVLSPVPVPFLTLDGVTPSTGAAFVFYPDAGDVDLASEVIDRLLSLGRRVFVKQRRKHQPIRSGGEHVYDDVWYPSEGIVGPASSDLVVGFGSSAYTDLVPIGIHYVNVDIRHNESPWSVFVHPDSQNYMRVTERDRVIATIDACQRLMSPQLTSVGDESAISFLVELLA